MLLCLALSAFAEEPALEPGAPLAQKKDKDGDGEKKSGDSAEKPAVTVKPGAMIFAHYGYMLGEAANSYNEFAIDRAYFTLNATMGKYFGAKLTLDVDRMKPVETDTGEFTYDTKYRAFLKHAYLEYKLPVEGMAIRAGMVDTPYGPFYDAFWQHRFITDSPAAGRKLVSTADLGVSLMGEHNGGLIGYQVGILNGEGYSKPEVDAGKAVQVRVTIDPMARPEGYALPITGFFSYSGSPTDELPVITYAGAVGFKMQYFWFWGDYMGQSKGEANTSLLSITAIPRVPKVANLVIRYERFDPETDTENDGSDRLIAGVSREFFEKVMLAATYETDMPEADGTDPTSGLFLHMQAGF